MPLEQTITIVNNSGKIISTVRRIWPLHPSALASAGHPPSSRLLQRPPRHMPCDANANSRSRASSSCPSSRRPRAHTRTRRPKSSQRSRLSIAPRPLTTTPRGASIDLTIPTITTNTTRKMTIITTNMTMMVGQDGGRRTLPAKPAPGELLAGQKVHTQNATGKGITTIEAQQHPVVQP